MTPDLGIIISYLLLQVIIIVLILNNIVIRLISRYYFGLKSKVKVKVDFSAYLKYKLNHTHVIFPGPGCLDISVISWPLLFNNLVSSRPTNPDPPPDESEKVGKKGWGKAKLSYCIYSIATRIWSLDFFSHNVQEFESNHDIILRNDIFT